MMLELLKSDVKIDEVLVQIHDCVLDFRQSRVLCRRHQTFLYSFLLSFLLMRRMLLDVLNLMLILQKL
uniref:Uncharacterized protein n=1 Tax=Helianthus annuus TaxID=4232 RepID=A0A251VEH8_HELAN